MSARTQFLQRKVIGYKDLPLLAEKLRIENRIVITSNGCFDILHWGHLRYLNEAKGFGDTLVVGINSDASVKRLKGDSRPIFDQNVRALQLACLSAVDYIVVFDQDTPNDFLKTLRPRIHVKGADYLNKPLPERALVESWGGKIELLPLEEGFSTTSVIAKLKSLPNE